MLEQWRATKNPTHFSMVGGMLHVPSDQNDIFWNSYIDQVLTSKVYLVEKITPRFRFFVDLDWIGQEPDYRAIIADVNTAIPGRIEMAVTPAKQRGSDMKYGMHLHWPDLIVGKTQALQLRESLPFHIRQFADVSVYNTGLRMLWSHKKDGSLPYVPIGKPWPDVRMMSLFSIRVGGDPVPEPTEDTRSPLLNFVHRYIPGHAHTKFKKMKMKESVTRIETDSRYCENIRREHRSNHVYFEVFKDTIRQKCFDDDCKGFEGKMYKLSPGILDALKTAPVSDPDGDFLDID
jgi:hypothetical protein